ncbi:MAG: IS110 family transposase [Oscillospiraceae bacterium]|nr:IS110 family transposase [Oscillospiraceae bacterium]
MISVGIDISKGKSTVCILKPYGEVLLSPREILHTESEIAELMNLILSFNEETKIIMEATGAYHLSLLRKFLEYGLVTCIVNPLRMKKYTSVSMRKGKTDNLDAIKIASYVISSLSFGILVSLPQCPKPVLYTLALDGLRKRDTA